MTHLFLLVISFVRSNFPWISPAYTTISPGALGNSVGYFMLVICSKEVSVL